MKIKTIGILLFLCLGTFLMVLQVRGQSGGFVIDRAYATNYMNVTGSSSLNDSISQTMPRFIVEYANGMRYHSLIRVPNLLQALLDSLELRFIIEYANANRFFYLTYPGEMIADKLPPIASKFSVNGNGTVVWETDEFATGELKYGTQSGVYTNTFQNMDFLKIHHFIIGGLTPGATYYFKFSNTDRSGNVYQSGELSVTINSPVYLPLLKK